MSKAAFLAVLYKQSDDGHKYEPVATADEVADGSSKETILPSDEQDPATLAVLAEHLSNFRQRQRRRIWAMILALLGILLFLYWAVIPDGHPNPPSCDTWETGFTCKPEISQYWGQYSPYFSVPSEIPDEVPPQCQINFVQILSRHGARDPTSKNTVKYNATVQKIHENATSYSKEYEFLRDYKYHLGADQLNDFGAQQLFNSGKKFYHRYKALARKLTPFVRASGQQRVIESAYNWNKGYHDARLVDFPSSDEKYPYPVVIISEETGSNNTLDHGLCTAFESSEIAVNAQSEWVDIFAVPIAARLNDGLPGANLDNNDALHIMDLCPFETVASSVGKMPPFCYLFTKEEWHGYGYYQSLGKYYGYSWGNPLGATQGVGFTNELIARMTASPVSDHTSTNHTLDGSKETFPVGGKHVLFADFSHDNDLTGIFSAIGLYNQTRPLLNNTIEDIIQTNGYSAAWTVPFAARAYFEKMDCVGEPEELVRVVVNDRVMPLETCGGDEWGRCRLSAFVESLSFAREGGHWEDCFT